MANVKHDQLSAAKVKTLTAAGQYTDGNGLVLRVEKTGSKRWVLRVTIDGKQRNMGLGGYPTVGLKEARLLAQQKIQEVRQGKNPIDAKRKAREEERAKQSIPTFAEAAAEYIARMREGWSNEKHARQWTQTLSQYACPFIGDKRVSEIDSDDVIAVLTPIWTKMPETSTRVRQRMANVFDYTMMRKWRTTNPAGKFITTGLPKRSRIKAHFRSIPYTDVPRAVKEVRESTADPLTRLGFEFLVLTASRSGQVRFADWSEFDEEARIWTLSAGRMKGRKFHFVPLSRPALSVLEEARRLGGGDEGLVFPSAVGKSVSDMAYAMMLRRLRIPAVPHGFRTSFRVWAEEQTNAKWTVAESALSHTIGGDVARAYLEPDWARHQFDQRLELMEDWGAFVTREPDDSAELQYKVPTTIMGVVLDYGSVPSDVPDKETEKIMA